MLAVWTSYPRSTDAVPLYMDLTLVLNGEARVVATRSAREAVADSIMCESWHAEKRKKILSKGLTSLFSGRKSMMVELGRETGTNGPWPHNVLGIIHHRKISCPCHVPQIPRLPC